MSNLTKLEFVALDISGKNYISWVLDAEIHLNVENLGETIKKENHASSQDRAKALIFLRRHLHEGLKAEYLTVKDPQVLWQNLKERFDHQKSVILPKARYEWIHLRLQDFKTVSEYNSAVFRITSKLKLCGENITDEDMLEKTFSTFHASNMVLQQQYREKGFKKYSDLISCLLVAEQNNELLMKNHHTRPTGSEPFPDANGGAIPEANSISNGRGRGRRHNRGGGRGRNHDRNNGHNRDYGRNYDRYHNRNNGPQRSIFKRQGNEKGGNSRNKSFHNTNDICTRCGMKGHWHRDCRTNRHFVDLYQASLKDKKRNAETHLIENQTNFTHFDDCSDFFEDPSDLPTPSDYNPHHD